MSGSLAISLAGGNLDFLAFLVLFFFAVAYGYYTISGSAITNHPHNGRDGAPGANRADGIHEFADRQAYAAEVRTAARDARQATAADARVARRARSAGGDSQRVN
jgi:hypothetical protein